MTGVERSRFKKLLSDLSSQGPDVPVLASGPLGLGRNSHNKHKCLDFHHETEKETKEEER